MMEQMHQLADEITKQFPHSDKGPQGDTQEAVFNTLQESFDSLTSTVSEKHKMLQHYIMLWKNYNDLKEDVSTIILDVQGSVDKLKERSHDPAVPPTTVVENAKVCVYLCVYICMYWCMCMYMCILVCIHVHCIEVMYVYIVYMMCCMSMYVCVCVFVCMSMRAQVCVCMYVHTYIHTHIHAYMHT